MKLSKWLALSGVLAPFALAITIARWVDAQPAGQFYEPKLTYKAAGLPESKTPEAACTASAAALTKNGNKQKYSSFKNGTTAFAITCMLKDSDGKVWSQTDNVSKVLTCDDGSTAISWNNSGTFESVKCRCDPAKGCPKDKEALPPTVFACPKSNGNLDACNNRKKRDAAETKRCTQQPERKRDRAEINQESAANKQALTSNRDKRRAVDKYNDTLKDIRAEERLKKEVGPEKPRDKKDLGVGTDQKGMEFPKFTADEMCGTGLPTDINIGSLCGNREDDFAAANNLVGHSTTPPDCTWHHHEELGRMQLVKTKAHAGKPHTGGVAVWKQAFGVEYPLCCP